MTGVRREVARVLVVAALLVLGGAGGIAAGAAALQTRTLATLPEGTDAASALVSDDAKHWAAVQRVIGDRDYCPLPYQECADLQFAAGTGRLSCLAITAKGAMVLVVDGTEEKLSWGQVGGLHFASPTLLRFHAVQGQELLVVEKTFAAPPQESPSAPRPAAPKKK